MTSNVFWNKRVFFKPTFSFHIPFKDYLTNRTQFESELSYQSSLSFISSGVPQGSIRGPLLFVLIINDLPACLKHCHTLMYTDDTVLFYAAKDEKEIETVLTYELEHLNNWLNENSLFLNNDKTECVLLGTGTRLSSVTNFAVAVAVAIAGELIKPVSLIRCCVSFFLS